jgi:hypothetical protein
MYKTIFGIFAASSWMLAAGPTASLGVAKSSGNFMLDGAAVYSNATIFDGSVIATQDASSVIRLSNAEVTLLPNSQATMHAGHITVEKGAILSRNQVVEAGNLNVTPASKAALVRVEILNANVVNVSTSGGAGDVRDSSGKVTSVSAGGSLSFNRNPDGRTTVGPFAISPIQKRPADLLILPKPVSKQ